MKIKLFTHSDLDGIGCGIIGKYTYGDNIDVEYVDYHNVNEIVESFYSGSQKFNYNKIFITDISVNEGVAIVIESYKDLVSTVLLDHHDTALWLNKYDWADVRTEEQLLNGEYVQDKTSGAYMFYRYLVEIGKLGFLESNTVQKFADIVRKYDTWQWKNKYNDTEPKEWNDLFYILGKERFINQVLDKIAKDKLYFSETDEMMLELEQLKINRYIDSKLATMREMNILGYKTGLVFGEQYHSELGNVLSTNNPHLDFITIVNIDKSVSYRTVKNNIHLGRDVAKHFAGGGHAQAAGSPIPDSLKDYLIKMLF